MTNYTPRRLGSWSSVMPRPTCTMVPFYAGQQIVVIDNGEWRRLAFAIWPDEALEFERWARETFMHQAARIDHGAGFRSLTQQVMADDEWPVIGNWAVWLAWAIIAGLFLFEVGSR